MQQVQRPAGRARYYTAPPHVYWNTVMAAARKRAGQWRKSLEVGVKAPAVDACEVAVGVPSMEVPGALACGALFAPRVVSLLDLLLLPDAYRLVQR